MILQTFIQIFCLPYIDSFLKNALQCVNVIHFRATPYGAEPAILDIADTAAFWI
jgi:hypothetical protein